jgi:D-alanyl-D-alanine carboxypeptidase/D-alanyl-D-alanine-endopeptidase (penicillin-binding protein 4)
MRDIPSSTMPETGFPTPRSEIVAKTGTLNFVSTLAGYVQAPSGRTLAFSVFCADLDQRDRLTRRADGAPAGRADLQRRAKRLQQVLLRRWGAMFG